MSLIFSVEQENDLLICGNCQTNFPLREITKFIRHKVNKCNKENILRESYGGDGEVDDEAVIGAKRTSISEPISRKESIDGSVRMSPRPSLESTESTEVKEECSSSEGQDEVKDIKVEKRERSPLTLKFIDVGSNTSYSGKVSMPKLRSYGVGGNQKFSI